LADDVYESRYQGYQIIVQGAEPIYAPGTGILIDRQKEIIADFARFTPEVPRLDANGERVLDAYNGNPLSTAVIYGHVFDLQQQAEEKGWTPEEVDLVRQKVNYQCRLTPHDVWLRSKAKAAKPWATYDETHHSQVAKTAEITGTIVQALAYERENKDRQFVVGELEAALATVEAEAGLTVA
jgi:hypothetical protein